MSDRVVAWDGYEPEVDMQKMCPNCSTISETEGTFCQRCGASYQQAVPQAPPPPASAYPTYSAAPPVMAAFKKASPAITITAAIAGVLGIIAPFLTWLSYDFDYDTFELNGWDSMKFPKYYDLYSAGAGVAMFLAVLVAAIGIGHLIRSNVSQKPYKSGERVGAGVALLIAGIGLLGNAIAQFGAFDEAAKLDSVFVETGDGLSLSGFVGAVALVLGILVLTVKSLIPVSDPMIR